MQEKPLIDYPEGMAPGRKAADQTITVLSTGAMLYFLAAITLGIWYFAGFYFVDSVFSWRQFEATTALLLQLLLVALVSLLLFLSWAEYNFRMYAHRNRRRAAPAVRAAEVAAFFKSCGFGQVNLLQPSAFEADSNAVQAAEQQHHRGDLVWVIEAQR